MKNTILLAALVLLAAACGGNKKETSAASDDLQTSAPTTPQEAMKQVEQAMKQSAELQQPVEPVNFRKLQELLPEKAGGYERTDASGETAGAVGIKMSMAKGAYKNSAGNDIILKIVDAGGLGMGVMSMAAWSTVTVDKEDKNGYERTTTLNGYKSFEKFRKNGESSEINLLAENRFIVTATCRGCRMETLRDIIGATNLSQLKKIQ